MKCNNIAVLRETLERMEIQQLDDMLLEELRKEPPDGELVRLIVSVLKERDVIAEIDTNIQLAWEQYQRKTQPVHKKRKWVNSWIGKAATIVLVLFTLFALLPQEAKAMNFFERFIAWTEDVFSLISPADSKTREAGYVFRTDNPGLQEVYDTAVELGVTVPVVPMWLPEGYELVECEVDKTPVDDFLMATFSNGTNEIVYEINVYSDNVTCEYYKDKTESSVIEKNGIRHTIIDNEDLLVVVWTVENIEYFIGIDCQEEVLNRILNSIYTIGG